MSAPSGPESQTSTPPAPPGVVPGPPVPTDAGPGRSGQSAPVPSGDPDWTDQVTDLIVDSVDKVRARTTGPILEGAKGSVYAIVALVILIPILVLLVVGIIRGLDTLIPGDVWVTYTIIGTLLVIVGVVMWSRRGKPTA